LVCRCLEAPFLPSGNRKNEWLPLDFCDLPSNKLFLYNSSSKILILCLLFTRAGDGTQNSLSCVDLTGLNYSITGSQPKRAMLEVKACCYPSAFGGHNIHNSLFFVANMEYRCSCPCFYNLTFFLAYQYIFSFENIAYQYMIGLNMRSQ
jgi:hypothetical protein